MILFASTGWREQDKVVCIRLLHQVDLCFCSTHPSLHSLRPPRQRKCSAVEHKIITAPDYFNATWMCLTSVPVAFVAPRRDKVRVSDQSCTIPSRQSDWLLENKRSFSSPCFMSVGFTTALYGWQTVAMGGAKRLLQGGASCGVEGSN